MRILVSLVLAALVAGCGDSGNGEPSGDGGASARPEGSAAPTDPTTPEPGEGQEPPPPPTGAPRVRLETSAGKIVVELDAKRAPKTVANFLRYVDDGLYDGTIFHRVVPDFVIQGGGYTKEMRHKQRHPPIVNEARNGLSNLRGTISMARREGPDTATSQFFINVANNNGTIRYNLDPGGVSPDGYAVFGKVVEGMRVVDKIVRGKTTTRGRPPGRQFKNFPIAPVTIQKATRVP